MCLKAAGMDDFLVKPFDERQMTEMLLRWLVPVGTVAADPVDAVAPPAADARKPVPSDVIDLAVIDGLRALDRKGGPSRLARAVSRFAEIGPPLAASIWAARPAIEERRRDVVARGP